MDIRETEKILKQNLNRLEVIVKEYLSFFKTNPQFFLKLKAKYKINTHLLNEIQIKAHHISHVVLNLQKLSHSSLFQELRKLILDDYGVFLDLLRMVFYQIVFYTHKINILDLASSADEPALNIMVGNYLILTINFKTIKNIANQYFFHDVILTDKLVVNNETELWQTKDMQYKEFLTDFKKTREYSREIVKPAENKIEPGALMLLQQQVSELIKNAIKHGNKLDPYKILRTWFQFNDQYYKVIIEDQGEGFQDIEKWNEFNKMRNKAIISQNPEEMLKYIAYKTNVSDDNDGGNALFAALEYWDSGLIFNDKKNKVLAVKYFFKDE